MIITLLEAKIEFLTSNSFFHTDTRVVPVVPSIRTRKLCIRFLMFLTCHRDLCSGPSDARDIHVILSDVYERERGRFMFYIIFILVLFIPLALAILL